MEAAFQRCWVQVLRSTKTAANVCTASQDTLAHLSNHAMLQIQTTNIPMKKASIKMFDRQTYMTKYCFHRS